MKLYNTGTEMFCFEHGGHSFFVYPKFGTFERKRESYQVEIPDSKKGKIVFTRQRDVWAKTSEEGVNRNYVEGSTDQIRKGYSLARQDGREDIKLEDDVIKAEMDRVAALESKMKEKEKELKEQENALAVKLATLKKVEEEAISRAASKHVK